jgi:hypothetical protein
MPKQGQILSRRSEIHLQKRLSRRAADPIHGTSRESQEDLEIHFRGVFKKIWKFISIQSRHQGRSEGDGFSEPCGSHPMTVESQGRRFSEPGGFSYHDREIPALASKGSDRSFRDSLANPCGF